jgi:carbon starvation protein
MSGTALIFGSALLLGLAYLLYGGYVSRRLGIEPGRKTPAHQEEDGVDYVPARKQVLLGHHFASIAGAGPIVGPVLGAVFGWLPAFLWILLGSIFVGAVHDFSALVASLRHRGRSIGEVIEGEIGRTGKILFLLFSWSALVLVVAVFAKVTAKTFVANPGVAPASGLFIVLALIFGWINYRTRIPLAASTCVGLLVLLGALPFVIQAPVHLSADAWILMLFVYCAVASVTPVWILLQPRDYLNSFLLYAVLVTGLAGVFLFQPTVQFPMFTRFETELGPLFPILFVTVACGAVSGFHSLVASGTTAKQLDSEQDARVIGYGAMLIEALLAVLALLAAVHLRQGQYTALKIEGGPVHVFSYGVGSFMASLGISQESGQGFAALAVSAFCLTTLDTATRLARFAFQEFFQSSSPRPATTLLTNRFAATLVTLAVCFVLVRSGGTDRVWPLFGSANQLLAALALLAVSVWIGRRTGKNAFVRYPMFVMFAVSLSALGLQAWKNLEQGHYVLAGLAVLLFVLAVVLVREATLAIRRNKQGEISLSDTVSVLGDPPALMKRRLPSEGE